MLQTLIPRVARSQIVRERKFNFHMQFIEWIMMALMAIRKLGKDHICLCTLSGEGDFVDVQ